MCLLHWCGHCFLAYKSVRLRDNRDGLRKSLSFYRTIAVSYIIVPCIIIYFYAIIPYGTVFIYKFKL